MAQFHVNNMFTLPLLVGAVWGNPVAYLPRSVPIGLGFRS
jgi:hypothetical protein